MCDFPYNLDIIYFWGKCYINFWETIVNVVQHLNFLTIWIYQRKGWRRIYLTSLVFWKVLCICNYSFRFRYLEHHVGAIATIEDGTEDFTACWQHQFVCRHLLVIIADQGYIIQPGLLPQSGERDWHVTCKIIPLETELLRHRDFW